jgi:glycosyltransferase involved in cell wall biosynthesis
MTEKKLISVIVPVYNEAMVLPMFQSRMTQVIDGLKDYDWKVIFIDDGSRNNS